MDATDVDDKPVDLSEEVDREDMPVVEKHEDVDSKPVDPPMSESGVQSKKEDNSSNVTDECKTDDKVETKEENDEEEITGSNVQEVKCDTSLTLEIDDEENEEITQIRMTPKSRGKNKLRVIEESDTEESDDANDSDLAERLISAGENLSPEIKKLYGEVAWCRLRGYPYWPGYVCSPTVLSNDEHSMRLLLPLIETHYWVYFYHSDNSAAVPHNQVAPWNDNSKPYRDGYPEKPGKKGKVATRKSGLKEAIEVAEKDLQLPAEQRVSWVFKKMKYQEVAKEPIIPPKSIKRPLETDASPEEPQKKRRGRPPKKANEIPSEKTAPDDIDKQDVAAPVQKKRGRPPKVKSTEDGFESTPAKPKGKPGRKPKIVQAESNGDDLESKEIKGDEKNEEPETMKADIIPPKQIGKRRGRPPKSSKVDESGTNINNMEEMAKKKKKLNDEMAKKKTIEKNKTQFSIENLDIEKAKKCARRLNKCLREETKESNDIALQIMNALIQVKEIKLEILKDSGLPPLVNSLRQRNNPNVAKTASALRKHMMQLSGYEKIKIKQNISELKNEEIIASVVETKDESPKNDTTESIDVEIPEIIPIETEEIEKNEKNEKKNIEQENENITTPEGEENSIQCMKERELVIEMIQAIISSRKVSCEIETALYDRFSDTTEEYKTQARRVIFGLKEHDLCRQKVLSGSLHVLELVFATDEAFLQYNMKRLK